METKPLLILPPRHGPDPQALWRAAIAAGWEIQRLSNWREEVLSGEHPIVIYGEPLFAQAVADRLGLVLVYPPDDFLPSIGGRFTHRKVILTTLRGARRITERSFIKPANDKTFAARVYASGVELPEGADEDTPVLVSEVVEWRIEFRCFIREGVLATSSPYVRGEGLAQDEEGQWTASEGEHSGAQQFVEHFLQTVDVNLPPAFVLDVGLIPGRGWAVVEANTAWGAGVCGANPSAVLDTLRLTCWPADAVPPAFAGFVR